MKIKIVLVLFLIVPFLSYSESVVDQLKESNKLLKEAYNKIVILEEENKNLKKLLEEAQNALSQSNEVLLKSYSRIEDDQKEIENLRQSIKNLQKTSVEVITYHWNMGLIGGYPLSFGVNIAYNLHFYPKIGIIVNTIFDFENNTPILLLGVKINLE